MVERGMVGRGLSGTPSEIVDKFGQNPDVDQTEEDLWDGGGTYPFPSTAQSYEVVSTSTDDDESGTGAQTVMVYTLDDAGEQSEQEVTLDGTTPVALTGTHTFVYRVNIKDVGTGGVNAGDVSVQVGGGGTVLATARAGYGTTLMAIYRIPSDRVGYLTRYSAGLAGKANANVVVQLKTRDPGESWRTRSISTIVSGGTSALDRTIRYPIPLNSSTDVRLTVNASADNTEVSGGFDIELYRLAEDPE